MSKRTYEKDAEFVDEADDLRYLVKDKRECWRANPSKATRRQRRYQNKLVNNLFYRFKNS